MRESLVERGGNFAGPAGDALVECIDVISQSFGHVLSALAKPPDQLATVILHGVVELGDVAGNQVAEVAGVSRNFLGEFGATLVEHVLKGLQACCQHLFDCLATAVERGDQRFCVLTEGIRNRVAAVRYGFGDAGAGLF